MQSRSSSKGSHFWTKSGTRYTLLVSQRGHWFNHLGDGCLDDGRQGGQLVESIGGDAGWLGLVAGAREETGDAGPW
jgi:hypothetical protein